MNVVLQDLVALFTIDKGEPGAPLFEAHIATRLVVQKSGNVLPIE